MAIVSTPDARAAVADTSPLIDPRFAFLLIAVAHHELVERGEEDVEQAFANVACWFDRTFPAEPECCPTCGSAPCINPSFCAECRRADKRRRRI